MPIDPVADAPAEPSRTGRLVETVDERSGARVTREATSGRFVAIETAKGVTRASKRSETAVRDASTRRSEALRRLADR